MRSPLAFALFVALWLPLAAVAQPATVPSGEPPAVAQLAAFAPFIGAWTGTVGSEAGEVAEDVQRFSWALGGHAVRNVHAVNGGAYAGETLFWWDAEREGFAYVYVTTAGFTTQGLLKPNADGTLTALETIDGDGAGGVTAVQTTMRPDGPDRYAVDVRVEQDGTWAARPSRTYARTPAATLPCALDPGCTFE